MNGADGPSAGPGTGGVERIPAGPDDHRGRAVQRAVEVLRVDGVFAHPTSTVYGLGARARSDLDRVVVRLKGYREERPLIRLAASATQVRQRRPDARWTDAAGRLAERFWPGGLTLVLEDGTENGLAVRVDGHPVARAVPAALDDLVSSTSLNRSGEAPARDPVEASSALESMGPWGRRCAFLDAGPLPESPPSTLLSLRADPPRVLRSGAVEPDEIRDCLGTEVRG